MSQVTKIATFKEDTITDQKRLVRGEQLLRARRSLRVRAQKHHYRWRVMMLPGSKPQEEIDAIRNLMPMAHITAVDKDDAALGRAIDAGVDDIMGGAKR